MRSRVTRLQSIAKVDAGTWAAAATGTIALAVYVATLTPGLTWSDWAEAQGVAPALGIMHPTGYPVYTLLGWAFSFVPIRSVAYRINLLSAIYVSAALAVGTSIARRLGVRPVIAVAAMLTVAFVPTVWITAIRPEVHALHVLFVALMLHRLALWAESGRPRDAIILAALTGLSFGNHMTTTVVAPFIALAAAWSGRRALRERPWIVAAAALAFALALTPYLYLPLRALHGGPEWARPLATWSGFRDWVTGTQFGDQTHILAPAALAQTAHTWREWTELLATAATPLFLAAALCGAISLFSSRPGTLLLGIAIVVIHIHLFIDFRAWNVGLPTRYLNAAWLVLGVAAAVGAEWMLRGAARVAGPHAHTLAFAALALPLGLAPKHWAEVDQSANRSAQQMVDAVFERLPANAVLFTFWDTLTPLRYEQEVEGRRPDVTLSVEPVSAADTHARTRPVFFLRMFEDELKPLQDRFVLTPVVTLRVSYGTLTAPYDRSLFRGDRIPSSGGESS